MGNAATSKRTDDLRVLRQYIYQYAQEEFKGDERESVEALFNNPKLPRGYHNVAIASLLSSWENYAAFKSDPVG